MTELAAFHHIPPDVGLTACAFANLFPRMAKVDPPAFEALREKAKQDGVPPIVLYRGEILDGRSRHAICLELGIAVPAVLFLGTQSEALDFVLALNRGRLTPSQHALIEARAAEIKAGK